MMHTSACLHRTQTPAHATNPHFLFHTHSSEPSLPFNEEGGEGRRAQLLGGLLGCQHCLSLGLLVLALKYSEDFTYTNRTWADWGGVSLNHLNGLEVRLLEVCVWVNATERICFTLSLPLNTHTHTAHPYQLPMCCRRSEFS